MFSLTGILFQKHGASRATGLITPFLLISLLIAACLPGLEASLAEETLCRENQWYIIQIGMAPAGYIQEKVSRQLAARVEGAFEKVVTETEMKLVLNRMGSRVELSSLLSTEEDSQGRLVASRSELKFSGQITVTEAQVRAGTVELRVSSGGISYTRSISYKGELLGPEGIRMMSVSRLRKIGDAVSAQTFVPEASLITKLTRTLQAEEMVEMGGWRIKALRMEESLEGVPMRRKLWLDEKGTLLKQEETGPFGVIEIKLADMRTALASVLSGKLPIDVYERSIVRSNIRLPRAKPLERLKVRLVHRNPDLGWPELDRPHQRVIEKTKGMVILEIQRPKHSPTTAFPVNLTEKNRSYLEPNPYLQSDDPDIQWLVHDLVSGDKDVFEAALTLERWVAENLFFDPGLVLAPASEIFKDRRGTCLGYATLLATLARAAGIPARIVLGYVYALGMFGGHAWTEILAGEEWIPLDAAIVNEGPADAARIAVVSSSLAEGLGELALGGAQQLFGQVDIEILEYEVGGKTWRVPEGAKSYTIEGNRYFNPWLGVELEKHQDFRFSKLDSVWPDRILLAMEGPGGAKIVLEQHETYPWQDGSQEAIRVLQTLIPRGKRMSFPMAGGKSAVVMANKEGSRAALALWRGGEFFILRVEAAGSLKILQKVARGLHVKDEPLPPKQ